MKAPRLTLTARVAGAFVVLTFVVASVFARMTYLAIDGVERDVIVAEEKAQLDWLIAREHAGAARITELPRGERLYVTPDQPESALPEFLRGLGPGWHERGGAGRPLHALVRQDGARTWYLVTDHGALEQRERFWVRFLGGAVITATLVALGLGLALARSALAPVRRLAARVAAIRPGEDPGPLAADYANDPVGVLARTFEARLTELRALLEQEQLFTGDVSHELRTPAAVIGGAAEVLAERPELGATARAAVGRIHTAAQDLNALIDAFALLGRSPHALARVRCRLDEVVRAQVERVRELHGHPGIDIEIDAPEAVTVDAPAVLLGVAVRNLVENAVRHAGDGPIRVRVRADEVQVEDAGPGVAAHARAWIFERHARAAPASVAGSGLGLAIVRRVCERGGWRVTAQALAPGMRFVLHLGPGAASRNPHAALTLP